MAVTNFRTPDNAPLSTTPEGLLELVPVPLPTNDHCAPGGMTNACQVKPYFDPQTIVSLDSNGQPLSHFGDTRWDIRSMGSDGGQTSCYLYFFEAQLLSTPCETDQPDLATLIREQHKALQWLHMDAGRPLAQCTVGTSTRTLFVLASGAYQRGVTLFELFCNPEMLGEESASLNSSYAKSARALLRTLWRHREFLNIGGAVRLNKLSDVIKKSATSLETEFKQTPIIPSRIYCKILANLVGMLDEIQRDLDTLLDAYRQERAVSIGAPKGISLARRNHRRHNELVDLREAMRARGWKLGSLHAFISGEITRIQVKLMNLVIAFTGMRIGEARILPLKGVLTEVTHRGSVHHVVNGYSHKLNHGKKKPASWITSREGSRAIVLARRIASTFVESLPKGDPANDEGVLLFCTPWNPCKMRTDNGIYRVMCDDMIPTICPTITQADIDELNAMELERGWQRESIEVGKPWPLRFHQYRRSLSVYAHRSGMVSLPALKGQLQHITDEMRAYYSDGFCRAVNLVFDKDHFSHEWNAAKAESSFLGYTLALLFSDEELLGRGVERMASTVSDRTRPETLQLFRDGKLAYKETVLGGCISIEECQAYPLQVVQLECLEKNCSNLIVSPKRLELVIRSQEIVVATLERDEFGSVEHRLEAGSLQVLLKARKRLTDTA